MESISTLLKYRIDDSYQRDNWDAFLSKTKFVYNVPSIHIAGTNGKGSTANYIASIYKHSGLKVGLFTTPSILSFNDDIKINDVPITDDWINKFLNDNKKLIEKFELSIFEVETFMALSFFMSNECDIAVIECGMGGEIDATNIFTPLLSIITTISLEHTAYLGRSLYEITSHKLGITREKTPLLIGNLPEDAIEVVKEVAFSKELNVFTLSEANNIRYENDGIVFDYTRFSNIKLLTYSDYSIYDACLAIDAVNILNDRFQVNAEDISFGLGSVVMPCRFQIVSKSPLIIIDGAHNPGAMKALYVSLSNAKVGNDIRTIFACFKDKNLSGLLNVCGEFSKELCLTTFNHPRARSYEDYFLYAEEYQFFDDAINLLNKLIESNNSEPILITGSLAFASYMYKAFLEGKINVSEK